ncbi:MAG: hypothetical protein HY360_13340 [Verrucomicrobia bacterium]|nr:hypothetical protein [Verrucomicrobiota bacterium]
MAQDNQIGLWDVTTQKETRQLHGLDGGVLSLAGSANENILASINIDRNSIFGTASCVTMHPHTVRVYNAATCREMWKVAGLDPTFKRAAFSPDGKLLALMPGPDCRTTIKLLDASTGKELRTIRTGKREEYSDSCSAFTFSPTGKTLASVFEAREVDFWDVASGRKLRNLFNVNGHLRSIAFSSSGNELAVGGIISHSEPFGVALYETASGRRLWQAAGHAAMVNCVAFSPSGKYFATASDDGTALIWVLPPEVRR